MNQALPAGLINPSAPDLNQASDDNVRFTNSEELHRFWKVYEAQNDYVNDPSILRLRNLFWRIWSSDKLATSVSNEKLNQLWLRCRRTDPITAIEVPRGFYQRYGTGEAQKTIRQDQRGSSLDSISKAGPTSSSTQQQSPALKSPPTGSASSGTATDLSSGQSERTETGRGDSNTTSTGSSESSGRPALRRNTSGSKSRPPVVAAGTRGRAKPALIRRKSSQSKTQQVAPARPPQQASRSPPTKAEEGAGEPPQPADIPGAREPAFTLPSASSWQSVDEPSPRQSSPIAERPPGQTGSLVDRDFRSKFLSSATNLPALARTRKTGSVVRFADEEEDTGKGKEKAVSRASSPEKIRPRERTASQVIDSDDSEETSTVQLPRTQSQLSMAIKDRRKKSGSRDLGPEAAVQQELGKKNETKRKEEELLKMGRQAAAPRIPKGRTGSAEDAGYRSPSPGPTF